ncbi:hypothetical protein BLOT_015084 [Blomia tropicalis]|nr:hypothetical protein BLOT_015084 [Blomia tropicalis]
MSLASCHQDGIQNLLYLDDQFDVKQYFSNLTIISGKFEDPQMKSEHQSKSKNIKYKIQVQGWFSQTGIRSSPNNEFPIESLNDGAFHNKI